MDIRVSHACPSCGGPVEMREADRLTECPFCDVKNYLVGGSMLRFVLPAALAERDPGDVFYFPYLRFKGNIFTCIGTDIGCKVLDTTHQGVADRLLPASLGLRPQAMPVRLVDTSLPGRFIRRVEKAAAVLGRAEKLARSVIEFGSAPLHHRAFIGETVSCIYLPLYRENGKLHDGVLGRPLGEPGGDLLAEANLLAYRTSWDRAFLAMICPRCGDAMQGRADSLIVHCFNCDSCWAEDRGRFVQIPFRLAADGSAGTVYLPFWRIVVVATGIEMGSLADLLATANQPVVVRQAHRDAELAFWIPALKIRPKVFLTLAKSATLSQLDYPGGGSELDKPLFQATLPLKEAMQAIPSVFAEIVVNRRDVLPRLPQTTFSARRAMLCFLPFQDTGHDYVQPDSGVSVAASVVRTGRRL